MSSQVGNEILLRQLQPRTTWERRSALYDKQFDPLLGVRQHVKGPVAGEKGLLSPRGRVRRMGQCFSAFNGEELRNVSIAYFASGDHMVAKAARSAASAKATLHSSGLETMLVTDDAGLEQCDSRGSFDTVLSLGPILRTNVAVTRFRAPTEFSNDSFIAEPWSGIDQANKEIVAQRTAKVAAVKLAVERASHAVVVFLDANTLVCRPLLNLASVPASFAFRLLSRAPGCAGVPSYHLKSMTSPSSRRLVTCGVRQSS